MLVVLGEKRKWLSVTVCIACETMKGKLNMEHTDTCDKVNAVFMIGDKLYFFGFEGLGEKVVLTHVDPPQDEYIGQAGSILRTAKQNEMATFILKNHITDSQPVIDYFVKHQAIGSLFYTFHDPNVYFQSNASIDIEDVDFSKQFPKAIVCTEVGV